jgi:hypothetical protein
MRARTILLIEGSMGAPPPLPVPRMPGSVVVLGGRDIERRGVSFDLEVVEGVCEGRGDGEDMTGPAIDA